MSSSRPNLLLVVLDSLRADRVGCYGHPAMSTPNLDALAAEGVRFANCTSESTWTLPSAFTLLTGLTPPEHRAELHRQLPEDLMSLPVLLREAGYATFGASNNWWISGMSGLRRGLERFDLPPHEWKVFSRLMWYVMQPLGIMNAPGGVMVSAFRRWVRRAKWPWFGLLWINDSHHPYLCPRPYVQQFHPRPLSRRRLFELGQRLRRPRQFAATADAQDLQDVRNLCSGAAAHVDSLVGRLAEELARSRLAEDTLLVVLSDHGDMLGEHGLVGHGPTAGMYQPLIHVPLIVRGPGFGGGAVAEGLAQLSDVTQTLAAVAGAPDRLATTTAARIDLHTALDGKGRSAAICRREPLSPKRLAREQAEAPDFNFAPFDCQLSAVIAKGWKLIARDRGDDELYHLAEDPLEEHNLLERHPRQAEALRALLTGAAAVPHASTDGLSLDDSEILNRRLQDLGYL